MASGTKKPETIKKRALHTLVSYNQTYLDNTILLISLSIVKPPLLFLHILCRRALLMFNMKFYKNGVGINEICIIDPEIRSYLASLGSDEERYKQFSLAIKLGTTILKDADSHNYNNRG